MGERRGVLAVFDDGNYLYSNKNDLRKHDDILWDMLAFNEILPDSYKRLTSFDDRFLHEKSSAGKEAMIAASNGILCMFLIYDNDSDYKYAIIYLPNDISNIQKDTFMSFFNNNVINENLNIYVVGTFDRGLSYMEINDSKYVPDFKDEETFMQFYDLVEYINKCGSIKRK